MLLRGYKLFISPYFRGSCRFLPSCADYAAEAFTRHGLTGGAWLSARRLARCHPLSAHGHDPVPASAIAGLAGRREARSLAVARGDHRRAEADGPASK